MTFKGTIWPDGTQENDFGAGDTVTRSGLIYTGICKDGRASAWHLLRLYCCVLVLAVPLVLWVFAIFATWSYILPNHLCLDAIQDSKVSILVRPCAC